MSFATVQAQGYVDTIPSFSGFDTDTIPTQDGYYHAIDLSDNKPIPYPKIDNRNIRFYKRIYRDIDLKDTSNYIFAMYDNSLMGAIMDGIQEGRLTPYEDDAFKTKLTARDGESKFADSVWVPLFDDEGDEIGGDFVPNEFDPNRITKFRLKEDIFLDKVRGTIEMRIIGVAPLMDINSSAELAQSISATPAFWLYFPQLRYSLAQVDVSDPDVGLFDVTMDDVIVQRKFASTIVRESSPRGQQAFSLTEEVDQQEQSAAIEAKIEALKANTWKNPRGVNADNLILPNEDPKQPVLKSKAPKQTKKKNAKEGEVEEVEETVTEGNN